MRPAPPALLLALALAAAPVAHAAPRFVGVTPQSPIAQGAIVPAGSELFFVSGIPGTPAAGTTEGQTAEVLGKLGAVLKASGYGLGDVVNAKVYLVGDPALGGEDGLRRHEHRLQARVRHARAAQQAEPRHRSGGRPRRPRLAGGDRAHRSQVAEVAELV